MGRKLNRDAMWMLKTKQEIISVVHWPQKRDVKNCQVFTSKRKYCFCSLSGALCQCQCHCILQHFIPLPLGRRISFRSLLNTATQRVFLLTAAQTQNPNNSVTSKCDVRNVNSELFFCSAVSSSSYNFFPDAQLLARVSPCRRSSLCFCVLSAPRGRAPLHSQTQGCGRARRLVLKPHRVKIIVEK